MMWIDFVESYSDISKILHNFRSNTIERQVIIDIIINNNKRYAFVLMSDSEVIFLEERENATFLQFLSRA